MKRFFVGCKGGVGFTCRYGKDNSASWGDYISHGNPLTPTERQPQREQEGGGSVSHYNR